MALTLNNFVGFETGGLEEAQSIGGAPAVNTNAPVRTGSSSLKLLGAAVRPYFAIDAFEGGGDQGDDLIVGFAFRTNDLTPSVNVDFLWAINGTSIHIRLRLTGGGDLVLVDSTNTQRGIEPSPFTVDTWHFIELRWQNLNIGAADVYIDGAPTAISVTLRDFLAVDAFDPVNGAGYRLRGGTTANEDIFIEDFYCMSGASGVGDFLGDAEVFKYQSVKASDTPDAGSVLDAGTWDKAGETPLAATATNPEYESTGAGSVDSNAANGSPEGPKNDGRIDGDASIKGMKGISNMKRSGGGGTAHYILMGNDVDGTTRSVDIDPTTAFVNYFFVSEAAGIVPLSTEYCSIGFEMDNAQDYECQEQWAMLLHVPSAVVVGPDEMMAAIGQQTGGGGGSGDIMAHDRKPAEVVAYLKGRVLVPV